MRTMHNFLKDKRGFEISSESAVYLVLVIAAGIVLFLIATGAIDVLNRGSGFEACQRSIQMFRFGEKPIVPDSHVLQCDAKPTVFSNKDVMTEAKAVRGSAQDLELGVKALVAGEMVWCWRMVGKGEVNPFNSGFWGEAQKASYCILCSIVEFDEVTQKQLADFNGQIHGLHNFIETEFREIEGEEIVYSDFLKWEWWDGEPDSIPLYDKERDNGRYSRMLNLRVDDTIDTSRRYAVVYGKVFGPSGGSSDQDTYVGFKPLDEVSKDPYPPPEDDRETGTERHRNICQMMVN